MREKRFLKIFIISMFTTCIITNCYSKYSVKKNYFISNLKSGETISVKKDNPEIAQERLDEIAKLIDDGVYYLDLKNNVIITSKGCC